MSISLPRKLMSLVNSIECSTNVHLCYMGVDCWPIVRNTFMTMVSHSVAKRAKKLSLIDYFHALFDFIYVIFRIDNTHSLVLTDFKYQVKVHGRSYFKDASVIKELLSDSGKKCHIMTQGVSTKHEDNKRTCSLFFLTALAAVTAKLLMRLDFRKVVARYLLGVYNSPELESLGFDSHRNFKQIEQNIYFVIVASFLFKFLLRRIRPEKCFIVCYYSCLGMALCVACRKLGIESIDLQHGVSGSNMRAYGQWCNLPEKGFNTLPQTFYCWTSVDVSAINSWSINTQHHKAVLTGNIWRQFLVEKDHLRLPAELELAREAARYRKVLLYTARNSDLPKLIVELLKQAPKDYFFIIRMHPDTSKMRVDTLRQELKLINSSCLVTNAKDTRIHMVVQLTDLHITEWSAVVYDAFFERTPSIVVSEVGRDYFSDFIAQGYVTYCDDIKDIIEKIEEPYKKGKCIVKFLSWEELRKIICG